VTTPADVVPASSQEDAVAVGVITRHHAELAAGLGLRVETLLGAAEVGSPLAGPARANLADFCARDLIPHALAEGATLYAAATAPALRLLVEAMIDEHRSIGDLVDVLASDVSHVRAAAAARALLALFEVHLAKENDLLVPRLAADPSVALAALLDATHEHVTVARPGSAGTSNDTASNGTASNGTTANANADAAAATTGDVGAPRMGAPAAGCGCGGHDEAVPELDVRTIPHAIRHATVFGAFDAIAAGNSLVLVAPHDPRPLLSQLSERAGGRLEVTYLERGPEAWRLQLTR
jgi:uncharacterized protein (DUF2249 family)